VFADVPLAFGAFEHLGLPFVIASNFDARLRAVILGLPELERYADRLVISSEVGYAKPHPRLVLEACARMGLPPSECLCVGDEVDNDVIGPISAGLHAVLVDRAGQGNALSDIDAIPDLQPLVEWLVAKRAKTLGSP
jgi:putative hydrolase of the HAD superfamily